VSGARQWIWAVMAAAPLTVWLSGCQCETHLYDQIYLLDPAAGAPLSGEDAAPATPASSDAAAGSDAAAVDLGPSLDCAPAAAGCARGAQCLAACDCIQARGRLSAQGTVTIKKCTLLDDGGPPSVEIRYVVTFSGCGD
jgi:hypothetical protein